MTPDLARLLDWFRPHAAGGVALAYSGGIDSAVLLAALATLRHESDFPCVALTLSTPLQRCAEVDEARVLAEGLGVPWQKVEANPLAEPAVATNAPDRCYACKRLIMARLREVAQGFTLLIDGTNADDRRATNRPGLRALDELGVRSPLVELGLTKATVRALARELDLPTPDRPRPASAVSRPQRIAFARFSQRFATFASATTATSLASKSPPPTSPTSLPAATPSSPPFAPSATASSPSTSQPSAPVPSIEHPTKWKRALASLPYI